MELVQGTRGQASGEHQWGGKVGLRNLGNTCFMSAGLQCLCHLEPLTMYFLRGRFAEDVNSANPRGCKGELAKAFAKLQKNLWQQEQRAYNPKALHRKLMEFAPSLFESLFGTCFT